MKNLLDQARTAVSRMNERNDPLADTPNDQKLRMYCCQPTVVNSSRATCTINPETTTIQVPTFYLHPNQLGILNLATAEIIVRDICNPTKDKNITVHPNVTAVTL